MRFLIHEDLVFKRHFKIGIDWYFYVKSISLRILPNVHEYRFFCVNGVKVTRKKWLKLFKNLKQNGTRCL